MSSRTSSVRPPYITIRSSRARAPSYVPPPSPRSTTSTSTSTSDESTAEDDATASRSSSPDPVHTAAMPRALLTSFFAMFHLKAERRVYSLSDSDSSSFDSLSLPVPASPQQATFGMDVWQEDGHFRTGGRPTARETVSWWSGGISAFAPMFLIIGLFPLSTILVVAGLFSLPITASFPRTLSELASLGRELQAYSDSGLRSKAHVLGVLSITAVWKHAWSIPGSVLLNVLSGVLMSPVPATLLMTALTAIGSIFSSLLVTPLAPVISQFFPKALALTRSALEGGDGLTAPSREKSPVWVRLSVLRLIGVVPWSGINIACGVTGVALFDCLLGAFIGTLPWTAVTCQIGDIMQTVASSTSGNAETLASLLRSPTVVIKLALLTFVSLVPILARDRLKSLIGRSPESEKSENNVAVGVVRDADGKRWWFKQWRKPEGVAVVELDIKSEKPVLTPS